MKFKDLLISTFCVCLVSIYFSNVQGQSHNTQFQCLYLQPIITQYFIDNKSEIWLLFLIAHSKR